MVGGLVGYLVEVGLDQADKIASVIGGLSALATLAATGLLRPSDHTGQQTAEMIDIRHSSGVQINQSGGNTQHNSFPAPR